MNNEIKEILFLLHNDRLTESGKRKLEDYITNLQQKEELFEKIVYKYDELKQENERLKTKTKEQSLLLIDYQDMEQKLEDYKSRIEKAVEYIEKSKEINYKTIDTLSEEVKLLKGILNGENVMLNNILNILNARSDE